MQKHLKNTRPQTMFAIVKHAAQKGLRAQHTPRPHKIGAHEVRLKVLYAGICGTDMHIYQWDAWAQQRINPPLILGHEFSAKILEVGTAVTKYTKGQLVSAECHIICGACPLCKTNQGHLCNNANIIGVDRDGAFCEELILPQESLWPISEGIDPKHGAIFDPIGNAMHTVTTHNVHGTHTLITGAGSIGLAAIAIAKAHGAKHISVVEPNTTRHKIAYSLGANAVYTTIEEAHPTFKNTPPEVFLEMSGHPQALQKGLKTLEFGAKVALLGLPSAPISLDLAEDIILKGVTIHGIVGRKIFETWLQVDTFLKENPHVPEALITHTVPAHDFKKAFDTLEKGVAIKAVLDFTTTEAKCNEPTF